MAEVDIEATFFLFPNTVVCKQTNNSLVYGSLPFLVFCIYRKISEKNKYSFIFPLEEYFFKLVSSIICFSANVLLNTLNEAARLVLCLTSY